MKTKPTKKNNRKPKLSLIPLPNFYFERMKECVGSHIRYDRIIEWIEDQKRKPATTAFTAGGYRKVAYAIEDLIRKIRGTHA